MIITCSYCKEDGHNINGCGLKKDGILPPVRPRSRAIPEDVVGDITQEHDQGEQQQSHAAITQDQGEKEQSQAAVTQEAAPHEEEPPQVP